MKLIYNNTSYFIINDNNEKEQIEKYGLTLSEVEEALYGVSVDDLAFKAFKKQEEWTWSQFKDIFPYGFNVHKELVKDRLFTIEDMVNIATTFAEHCKSIELLGYIIRNYKELFNDSLEEIGIQSLLPKTEWEVEFDEQGKLILL